MLNMILMSLIVGAVNIGTLMLFALAFLLLNGVIAYDFVSRLNVSKVVDMFLPKF